MLGTCNCAVAALRKLKLLDASLSFGHHAALTLIQGLMHFDFQSSPCEASYHLPSLENSMTEKTQNGEQSAVTSHRMSDTARGGS